MMLQHSISCSSVITKGGAKRMMSPAWVCNDRFSALLSCLRMEPVRSTAEILAFKVLNRDIDGLWIEWASEMLLAGHDTEHLRILAGERAPFDQFYLHRLTDIVFSELNLDHSDTEQTVKNYASYLIERTLNGESVSFKVLTTLKDLCIELGYAKYLYSFYLLYFATFDLVNWGDQHYWEGATKENIEEVTKRHFTHWRSDPSNFA